MNEHIILRGGSWVYDDGCLVRSAYRGLYNPGCRSGDTGFRLALDSIQPRRIIRAGSWLEDWFETRSAHRSHRQPCLRGRDAGLRLGLTTSIER